jgi:glycosyltransferase involved in cell wall biosynthesis
MGEFTANSLKDVMLDERLHNPAISVLMATHNGASTLERVLDAYARLRVGDVRWHMVVVDNASVDGTPTLLRQYAQCLPLLALRTEKRGKNVALNLGLAHCHGDLVVLTDDDAVPEVNWLQTWQATVQAHPDFGVFGGRINPLWPEGRCPEWIPRLVDLGAAFAVTPEALSSGPIGAAWVWGPNMAIRRSIFDAGHRFDETVGPAAGQYRMGSETEFTRRLERTGHPAWYSPEVCVGHIIRPGQLDPEWIIQRAYRLGRQTFHESRDAVNSGAQGKRFRGAPRWVWRRLVKERLRSLRGRLLGDFDSRFRADWEVSHIRGYLDEAARHA